MSPRQLFAGALPAAVAIALGAAGAPHAATPSDSPAGSPAGVIEVGPRTTTYADLPATSVVADGSVDQVVRSGDRVYVLGGFDQIGRYSGPGRVLDATTGADRPAPVLPDGQVSVTVPDGDGGWYVGGDFGQDRYEHVEGGLQHVLADGSVDTAFDAGTDGLVSALALDGDTLYVGGDFGHVDGSVRQGLAAVSADDGHLLPFRADQEVRVAELAAGSGRVYVGTGQVQALDSATGDPVPGFASPVEGQVTALTLGSGRLYVGTSGLVALDPVTGAKDAGFDVEVAGPEGRHVHTVLDTGETLYVGSDAGTIAGRPGRLVALDPATGAADASFDPQVSGPVDPSSGAPAGVYDLDLSGGRLWVGGTFAEAGGQAAHSLAVVDPGTGAALDVDLPSFDHPVNAVDVSGSGVYVGGKFFLDEPSETRTIAALDATTLEPLADFHVTKTAFYGDLVAAPNALYVASTHFYGYDPDVSHAPYYDNTTETIRAFDPDTGAADPTRTHRITDLTGFTTVGNRLVVAQRLQDDVKYPRNRITVYGPDGRKQRSFPVPMGGYISYLTVLDGDLLVIGSFKRIPTYEGLRSGAIARLSLRNGALNTDFDSSLDGPAYHASVSGKAVYVTGLFSFYPEVTKMDAFGNWRYRFKPKDFDTNGVLLRTAPVGDRLWVGLGRNRFLDTATGAVLPDPTGGHQDEIDSVTAADGGIVFGSTTYGINMMGSSWNVLGYVGRVTD